MVSRPLIHQALIIIVEKCGLFYYIPCNISKECTMTSAIVDNGSSSLEFDSNGVQIQVKENEPISEYPAVIVEPLPTARVEQRYAAQIFVYDDETYLLQDVAEEQEVETETVKTAGSTLLM